MFTSMALFIPSLEFGGAERVTTYLADYFSRKKYKVYVFTSNKQVDQEYKLAEGVERIRFSGMRDLRQKLRMLSINIGIIMFAPMAINVSPVLLQLRIPFIISERNDPTHFAGKKITLKLYQFAMRFANGIVYQTKSVQEYYINKIGKRGEVIFNPLNVDAMPEVNSGKRDNLLINVGRLHPQKNQEMIIRTFQKIHDKYPNYRLDIYGEGELREYLQNLIHELQASEYINLKGTTRTILEIENSAKVFVLSSNFEGMPNALIEAMAMGVPCISTACPCGGPEEIIEDHRNGTLVPVADSTALEIAILELIEKQELWNQYHESWKEIRDKLAYDKVMKEWESYCKFILEESST